MDLLKDFFISRKAQALLLMILVIIYGQQVGLTLDQIENMTNVMVAFIIGRAIHDHKPESK